MVEITFEKSAGKIVLEILGFDNEPKCHYCGVDITGKNLGGVFTNPARICCTKLSCLIQTIPFVKS